MLSKLNFEWYIEAKYNDAEWTKVSGNLGSSAKATRNLRQAILQKDFVLEKRRRRQKFSYRVTGYMVSVEAGELTDKAKLG